SGERSCRDLVGDWLWPCPGGLLCLPAGRCQAPPPGVRPRQAGSDPGSWLREHKSGSDPDLCTRCTRLHYVEEATGMGKNERMRRLYANHLGREERVLASVRGTVETGRGEPWTGLLLATDRRLAFIA